MVPGQAHEAASLADGVGPAHDAVPCFRRQCVEHAHGEDGDDDGSAPSCDGTKILATPVQLRYSEREERPLEEEEGAREARTQRDLMDHAADHAQGPEADERPQGAEPAQRSVVAQPPCAEKRESGQHTELICVPHGGDTADGLEGLRQDGDQHNQPSHWLRNGKCHPCEPGCRHGPHKACETNGHHSGGVNHTSPFRAPQPLKMRTCAPSPQKVRCGRS